MKSHIDITRYQHLLNRARAAAISYEKESGNRVYGKTIRNIARQHGNIPVHLIRAVIAHGQQQISQEIEAAVANFKAQHQLKEAA